MTGHPGSTATPGATTDWLSLAVMAASMVGTPCYVVAAAPIRQALVELDTVPCAVRRRYWLSMKTQPVKPLIAWWRRIGRGIEVVSEYELLAARAIGFTAERILVNGVAKHSWLHRCAVPSLNVHFDSLGEVDALLPLAKSLGWKVGIRCQPRNQTLPEHREWPDQFGMSADECLWAVAALRATAVPLSGFHFHLGTSLADHREYVAAVEYVAELAARANCTPEYLDIGGGLPDHDVVPGAQRHLKDVFEAITRLLPAVREIWLENGRFVSGRAGALVVRIVDTKERGVCRHVICDGGRINHARPAAFERHDVLVHPARAGAETTTVVSGPSSANVDQLGVWRLPRSVERGDLLIWKNAGAYHVPLETRFSSGLAPVVWVDERGAVVARRRETAAEWWSTWE